MNPRFRGLNEPSRGFGEQGGLRFRVQGSGFRVQEGYLESHFYSFLVPEVRRQQPLEAAGVQAEGLLPLAALGFRV